jgi:hypothetical protein
MSPLSDAIERMSVRYGVPVLDAQEFWAERAAIREYEGGLSRNDAETAAIDDTETWARLWISLNASPDNQTKLKGYK